MGLLHSDQMGQFGFGAASSFSPSLYPGAALDLDFQNGLYYQAGVGNSIALVSCSRASTGYVVDSLGAWTSIGANLPRVGSGMGLLVEEARTNSVRNDSAQGAAAGTPGTVPTNTTQTTVSGIATSVVGSGAENGIDYVDLRWNGTAAAGGSLNFYFETSTGVAAVKDQVWTISSFFKLQSGSATGINSFVIVIDENTSGGAFVTNGTSTITAPTSAALSSYRPGFTRTLTGVTTGAIRPYFNMPVSNGAVVDVTLRFGWPQLELGAFATSPIRTTSAAVARAADVTTLVNALVFGSAYTLFGRAIPNAPTTSGSPQELLYIDDGSANNRAFILRNLTTGPATGISTSATTGTVITAAVWTQNVSGKLALADATGDQAVSFNGGAIGTGAGSLPVGVNRVILGANTSSINLWNGYIARIAIWPNTRLSNADLQRITA